MERDNIKILDLFNNDLTDRSQDYMYYSPENNAATLST